MYLDFSVEIKAHQGLFNQAPSSGQRERGGATNGKPHPTQAPVSNPPTLRMPRNMPGTGSEVNEPYTYIYTLYRLRSLFKAPLQKQHTHNMYLHVYVQWNLYIKDILGSAVFVLNRVFFLNIQCPLSEVPLWIYVYIYCTKPNKTIVYPD